MEGYVGVSREVVIVMANSYGPGMFHQFSLY